MSKVADRVTFYEDRGLTGSPEHFRRVEIKYANGETFFRGWIQDFGETDSTKAGPTVFALNYVKHRLDPDDARKREQYWENLEFDPASIIVREAKEADLDELIDLNFQNYFEDNNNRTSAYQGLNFGIDDNRTMFCLEINGRIFGFLYMEWQMDPQGNRGVYLDSLYCAPAIRGHDLNSKLIAAGIKKAREKGCRYAYGLIMGPVEHYTKIVHVLEKSNFMVAKIVPSEVSPLLHEPWYDVHVAIDLGRAEMAA